MPEVHEIFVIHPSTTVEKRYKDYRAQVESSGHFSGYTYISNNTTKYMTSGNEQRRFHGTQRRCSIGVNGHSQLCDDEKCRVCGIIKNSFHSGINGNFGPGIYFSAASSKANYYSCDVSLKLETKCMLLCKVVVGKATQLRGHDTCRIGPDAGDHSVIGELKGYDEVVVYVGEACIPRYLISYSCLE